MLFAVATPASAAFAPDPAAIAVAGCTDAGAAEDEAAAPADELLGVAISRALSPSLSPDTRDAVCLQDETLLKKAERRSETHLSAPKDVPDAGERRSRARRTSKWTSV